VLDWLEGVHKAVIGDAAEMGKPPGTVVPFRPEEARSRRVPARLSLHEGGAFLTRAFRKLLKVKGDRAGQSQPQP
jgi:Ni,Fe-hydrogenase maturation factor